MVGVQPVEHLEDGAAAFDGIIIDEGELGSVPHSQVCRYLSADESGCRPEAGEGLSACLLVSQYADVDPYVSQVLGCRDPGY